MSPNLDPVSFEESEGSYTCDNGEMQTEKHYNLLEATIDGVVVEEIRGQGFIIVSFKDGSNIIMKSKSTTIPDRTREAKWIVNLTADFMGGTGALTGLKEAALLKVKYFPMEKQLLKSPRPTRYPRNDLRY